jgi:hypothetical protein
MILNYTDQIEGGKPSKAPFGNHRTHRTRVALLLHKYIMFCGFWLCIGFAISEMVSDSNTVIKTDDFGVKIRQTAAIIPHEKQKNIKK